MPKPTVGVLQQLPGTLGQVFKVVNRGLTQFALLGAAGDLLFDEEIDLLNRGGLALEVPLDGGVEDAFDAAQVLSHLLDLLGDVEEEVHVFFLVAPEVMHAHVTHLTVA